VAFLLAVDTTATFTAPLSLSSIGSNWHWRGRATIRQVTAHDDGRGDDAAGIRHDSA
jgi:hypothetical protein